jgi:uncharacterized membrane protein YkvA (DUF1232 family)
MRTAEMRRTITKLVQEEERSHKTATELRQLARDHRLNVSDSDVEQMIQFLIQYVEHVPAVIEATEAAAQARGLHSEAAQFLGAAEQYWFDPHDVFPDHLGLMGYVDDAYVCLSVIQQMSSNLQQRTGQPLISLDLAPANKGARFLIGEPWVSQLDIRVQQIMGGPSVQAAFDTLLRMGARIPTFNVPDPIWGNASVDEIVNARLGAMGIV